MAMYEDKANREIDSLIGKSAGEICYHNFRYHSLRTQALGNAAETMWEHVKSPWILVEIWNDGTTVWQSPEGDVTTTVDVDGDARAE